MVSEIDKKDLEHIPICHIHNIIQDKCKSILEDTNNYAVIFGIVGDILELSLIAEHKGQKMEDRLKKYRESIEGLGFKRVKKL